MPTKTNQTPSTQKVKIGEHSTKLQPEINFRYFVIVMAMIFSLSPFAIDMYLPAFPKMATDLQQPIDAIEITVTVYLLFFAVGQFVIGGLIEYYNRSKILSLGLATFILSSVMIALSSSITELYYWRALQAFSAGCSVVVYTLVHSLFDAKRSSQVISYIMACVVIAPMIAPFIGSQVMVAGDWHAIFYILAILALITLICQRALVPPHLIRKIEANNAKLNKSASGSSKFVGLLKSYKTVITDGTIMTYVLSGAFAFAGMFAFLAGSPFVYIEYFGITPTQFSLLIALNASALISMNIVNARFLHHITPTKKLIFAGCCLVLVGSYLALTAYFHLSIIYMVVGIMCYVGLLGLTAANAVSSALSHSKGNTGAVSGISGVSQFGLGGVASAVVGFNPSVDARVMCYTMASCAFVTFMLVCRLKFSRKVAHG